VLTVVSCSTFSLVKAAGARWLNLKHKGFLVQDRIDEVKGALTSANVTFGATRSSPKDVDTYDFKKDPKDFNVYWYARA